MVLRDKRESGTPYVVDLDACLKAIKIYRYGVTDTSAILNIIKEAFMHLAWTDNTAQYYYDQIDDLIN